jgi:hypothetical protein
MVYSAHDFRSMCDDDHRSKINLVSFITNTLYCRLYEARIENPVNGSIVVREQTRLQ